MSDPTERDKIERGAEHPPEEGPTTDRPPDDEQPTEHPTDDRPTSNELRAATPVDVDEEGGESEGEDELDQETTVNLTGDLDATVNLKGSEIRLPVPDRDDAAVTSDVTRAHLKGLLEALIFASDRPIKAGDLAKTASAATKQVKELLEELKGEYTTRGMQLDEVAGGWIFRTNAAYAPFVRDLTKQKPVKLTRAQIETLSIMAYRQPITRPEIDDIRGVDCGPVLKLLLERDLVRILGKKDEPGRPILYGTTTQFLEFFGLKSLRDLPTLREFTDLNEESRRTVEKELGEVLESTAEAQRAVEHEAATSGDTLPPGIDDEPGTSVMNTEIPPAITTSEDMEEAPPPSGGAANGKGEGEIDPEEEFPDDDDEDFDDDEEDEDDEDDDDDEKDDEADG